MASLTRNPYLRWSFFFFFLSCGDAIVRACWCLVATGVVAAAGVVNCCLVSRGLIPLICTWYSPGDDVYYTMPSVLLTVGGVGVDQHAAGEVAFRHEPLYPGAAPVAAQRPHR